MACGQALPTDRLRANSHDRINRNLRGEKLTPQLRWDVTIAVELTPKRIDQFVWSPNKLAQGKLIKV